MQDRKKQQQRRRRGITLIEMLVVLTIIGLLAAVVGPRVFNMTDKGRITAARMQMSKFMDALTSYKADTGTFPTTEQGLEALWTKPENVPNWAGPYLQQEVPNDPWGRPYVYKFPGGPIPDAPEIISLGADGQPGGEAMNADIVSWKSK